MKPIEYETLNELLIKEAGSLQQFYHITNELSKKRTIKFKGKEDFEDVSMWNFSYRRSHFSLQYHIYSGITLSYTSAKSAKTTAELAEYIKKIF